MKVLTWKVTVVVILAGIILLSQYSPYNSSASAGTFERNVAEMKEFVGELPYMPEFKHFVFWVFIMCVAVWAFTTFVLYRTILLSWFVGNGTGSPETALNVCGVITLVLLTLGFTLILYLFAWLSLDTLGLIVLPVVIGITLYAIARFIYVILHYKEHKTAKRTA